MVSGFAELLTTLESADFFIGVLPFVITYSIFYITLSNAPKFGEDENARLTILVSVSIAFLVSYFTVSQGMIQYFFVNYFGTLTVGLLGIMGLFVAFALTGLHEKVGGAYWWGIPVVILVGAAWTASGGLEAILGPGAGNSGLASAMAFILLGIDWLMDTGLIWALLIFGAVAWAAGDPTNDSTAKNVFEWLGNTVDEDDGGGHS